LVCEFFLTSRSGRSAFVNFSYQTSAGRSAFVKFSRQTWAGQFWFVKFGRYLGGKGAALKYADLRWGGVLLVCFHIGAGGRLLRAIIWGLVLDCVERVNMAIGAT
jgi:hypothetical protein